MTEIGNSRRFAIVIGLGLLIRLLMIASPGTEDMHTNQIWGAWAVEQGIPRAYILKDSDYMDKFLLFWHRVAIPVTQVDYRTEVGRLDHVPDYPPLSIYQFWLSAWWGKLLGGGRLGEGPLLNAIFNVLPVFFSLGIALAAWRWARARGGPASLLALAVFWLNPALILHTPVLGYVDAVFAFFGLGSLIALSRRKFTLSVICLALASGIKPQGVLILPIVVMAICLEKNRGLLRHQLGIFVLTALLPFTPFVFTERFLAALRGTLQGAHVNYLSTHQMNIWWIVTWIYDALSRGGLNSVTGKVILRRVEEFPRLLSLDVRLLALLMWSGFMFVNLRWLWQELRRGNRPAIFWAGALQTYGFTMLTLYPKENHLYAFFVYALPLLFLRQREFTGIYAALSIIFGLNLFLFDGFGRGMEGPGHRLRMGGGFDLTVPTALANLAVFVWLTTRERWLFGLTRGTEPSQGGG